MRSDAIPDALSERLGPEATDGLLRLFEQAQTDSREDVITACTDRFERRLVQETAALRVQIAQLESSIRQEVAGLRADMAAGRFELLKWAFLFWVGQVAAIGTIVGVMTRTSV